jgi:aspartyl-tRNA(Asn)/glutamyl-tRNA(Gln) amidotransferase subunit A
MPNATSISRLAAALERIDDPRGEGRRAFLTIYRDTARDEAEAADRRARRGRSLGPLDGVIVSIKDLFDVAGEPTRSGSRVHAEAPPATQDAPAIHRLRSAGAVIIGKTNMTEFACSGIGINPHYGTPGNPYDRARIPGGSSSGAVVSVLDGMAEIAIGSDTGGSTRIPAAFCGAVGFKPTQHRIPRTGAFPLSPTLDSVGPIATSVGACALADAIMAQEEPVPPEPAPLAGLRVGVVAGRPLAGLDAQVARDFERALARLVKAGARLSEVAWPHLEAMAQAIARSNFSAIEVLARLEPELASKADQFDPIVRARIEGVRGFAAVDYIRMKQARAELKRRHDLFAGDYDVFALPTLPIIAPRIADLADRDAFLAANTATLRNTSIANFFDLPSISLPMHEKGSAPTGLMLFGQRDADRRLLAIAAAVESALGD